MATAETTEPIGTSRLDRLRFILKRLLPPDRHKDAERLHCSVGRSRAARSLRAIDIDLFQARLRIPPANVIALKAQP